MPNVAKPGDAVTIMGGCNDPAFTTAPVMSSVLDAPDLWGKDDGSGGWTLFSHATVKKDAKPGNWPVSYMCGTVKVTGHLRVEAADAPKPGPRVDVVPAKGRAGEQISVRVNCPGTKPTATSAALTIGDLVELPDSPPDLPLFVGVGTVKDVKPGAYKVNAKCDAEKMSTTFTVVGKPQPAAMAQIPVKPKGAPETGEVISEPVEDASSPTALVLGGAGVLLASAGAGGWLYLRRRRA